MFKRTVSEDELRQLKTEREAADRRYNDALTAVDAVLVRRPEMPHPPPGPDEHQVTPLNRLWNIVQDGPALGSGLKGRLLEMAWRIVAPMLERQQEFNSALVDHVNRNVVVQRATRDAIETTLAVLGEQLARLVSFQTNLVAYLQQITAYVDTKDREVAGLMRRINEDSGELLDVLDHRTVALGEGISGVGDELQKRWESMVAREQRYDARVTALNAAHEGFQTTLGIVQQATLTLKREVERLMSVGAEAFGVEAGSEAPGAADRGSGPSGVASGAGGSSGVASGFSRTSSDSRSAGPSPLDAFKYVGFEDQFRGSQDQIRARLGAYVPLFAGASDVLDVGCGRGEFLELLRTSGVGGRGIDVNHEMVEVCRARGLDVTESDALAYVAGLPDQSLGGLFAAQVVEHLAPDYLMRLIEASSHKLRPGARIVLETINPACWFAFFESYIRDITHVRPLHPDTLKYLLQASGFQRVEVRFSAPYPDHEKLRALPPDGELSETFNANMEKLNGLLFSHLDYAVIGEKL